MINGLLNINKEQGYTSHDVVAKLRKLLNQKKIGHTGTLDPEARGVLPICLGKATKVSDMLTNTDKEYVTTLTLGIITDTQDHTGNILEKHDIVASENDIERVIYSFIGAYEQIPPMYSAIKINGRKLYELAREGKTIERKPRSVVIYNINILNLNKQQITMRVNCSKGTYIRTLCHDIGQMLGCGAHMSSLIRTKVDIFNIEDSYTLDEIKNYIDKQQLLSIVKPIDEIFFNLHKAIVYKEYNKLLYNGNQLQLKAIKDYQNEYKNDILLRIYDEQNNFIGIYKYIHKLFIIKPVKIFL